MNSVKSNSHSVKYFLSGCIELGIYKLISFLQFLQQTQTFCNLKVQTFDISNLNYLIDKNLQFEISKVYDIGLQKYMD